MEPLFITSSTVTQLLRQLPEGDVFAIVADSRSRDVELLPEEFAGEVDLTCVRPPSSPRSVLFPMREVVVGAEAEGADEQRSATLVGVRACDLRALRVLDQVLLAGEFRDPFYASRREHTLIISVDCVMAAEECFCTRVEGMPHPNGSEPVSYDINLSPVEGGFVVEVGSEKGKEAVVLAQGLFTEATPQQLAAREASRQRMVETVTAQNTRYETSQSMSDLVRDASEAELLARTAAVCSECGACTLVCPTCHCFLLYDQLVADDQIERVRSLDSCLYASYSRMAGAGGMKPTPRPDLRSRFLNRLLHKFVWLPQSAGLLGCVGCGRCIEADMGGLDLRQFIHQLEA